MSEDEDTALVLTVLGRLRHQNRIWNRNYSVFQAMSPRNRQWWWRAAKEQAAKGAPAMQTLVTAVIEALLTR